MGQGKILGLTQKLSQTRYLLRALCASAVRYIGRGDPAPTCIMVLVKCFNCFLLYLNISNSIVFINNV